MEPVRGHLPATPENDVLVVAFAASQAEPEWLGAPWHTALYPAEHETLIELLSTRQACLKVLSQVYSGDVSVAEAELQISMDDMGKFSGLFRDSVVLGPGAFLGCAVQRGTDTKERCTSGSCRTFARCCASAGGDLHGVAGGWQR